MRVFLKVSEKRKQDLILLAENSANTIVQGVYYKGCKLTKFTDGEKSVLQVK